MDREMGNETEFEMRNGQEMGNKMEFETRNRRKWETRRDKSFFNKKPEKQGKTGEKTGDKNTKTGEKNRRKKKQKITRNTETRFRRGSGKCC